MEVNTTGREQTLCNKKTTPKSFIKAGSGGTCLKPSTWKAGMRQVDCYNPRQARRVYDLVLQQNKAKTLPMSSER